ncbi:MAG: hypothetical protein IH932_03410 [Thaumarchaeota archaeon]|nr:hypothetical protein [Nitrososphaerota archaeon]
MIHLGNDIILSVSFFLETLRSRSAIAESMSEDKAIIRDTVSLNLIALINPRLNQELVVKFRCFSFASTDVTIDQEKN